AGLAVLGLLEYAADKPNDEVDRTVRQAVRFYRNHFDKLPTRDMAVWMIPAMSAAYRRRPDPPVSDFIFAMADWLAARQIQTERGAPDLLGGVPDAEGTPDAATGR